MNTRAFTLALIIAMAAAFMVYTTIEDQKTQIIKKYGRESSVVVAKVDIKGLELIDDSKITVISVPEKFRAPGHFKTVKELESTIATVPILKGEQITKPRVTYPGTKSGLSRQVAVGKRAVAISVNEQASAGKLIKPGDRVDVLAAIDVYGGRKDKQKVVTILQDVLVLSTGFNITNSIPIMGVKTPKVIRKLNLDTYTKYNTVSLELDPYQVQKLFYLMQFLNGEPYLSLRNNSDKKIVRISPTSVFDILTEEASEIKAHFSERYDKKK